MSTEAERQAQRIREGSSLYKAILEVVSEHDPEKFEAPGDEWLFRPNPDEAELSCDALAAAVYRRILPLWSI